LLGLAPGYRMLQFASFSFDGSCQEIFNTLCSGGTLILVSKEEILSAESMGAVLKDQQVDIATLPPSYQHVVKDHIDGLKMLYSAGEPLNAEIGRYIQSRGVKLINGYGPTENTVTITLTDEPILEDGTVTIGRPLKNVEVYIVDGRGKLVPQGVSGEIWVSGVQVAKGYLNRPELTEERFAINPFGSGTVYKTGDRGRWLANGTIEYVGRKDDQVKIRGYRVELGEVEAALQMASGVLQAVVVATGDNNGASSLMGFIVRDENDIYDKDAVIAYLESRLPEYMVPRVLVEVIEIPMTVNGKADKKRLLQLSQEEQPQERIIELPTGELEEQLAAIWKDLLEVEVIDRKDDFFSLGGHSLLAIRLISAIKKDLNKELTIKDVFDNSTFVSLAQLVQQTNDDQAIIGITRSEREGLIPLSFSQEQLWFVDRLKGTVEYHMPYVFRLKGALDQKALENAFRGLINRHEALRTVIIEQDGRGYQQIRDINQWKWQFGQVREIVAQHSSLQQYIEDVCAKPFDLSAEDPLRVILLKENEQEYILIAVIHHIAFDGWSMSVMVEELAELYRSQVQGVEPNLKELPIQYADYAIWQRKYFSEEVMESKLNYWKEQLKGLEPLKLSTDYPRPSELSIKGGSVNRTLNKELLTGLQQLCEEQGVTMFMLMLGAFKVLLHRYSTQTDICIGCPIAGRQQKEIEGLIGFFVNTLVLRSEVEGDQSFINFLQKIRRTTLDAYDHQQVPFEQVVKSLALERDISRHPVFDVRFQLQNVPEAGTLDLGGVELAAQSPGEITALSDLGLDIKESENVLSLRLVYCSDLYKQDSAERMLEHYEHLLRSIVANPATAVSNLQLLGRQEEQLLLETFGSSSLNYPKRETVVSLFRQQALKTPDATAVVFEETQVSYAELDARSNQLAHYLRGKGVKNEDFVVISVKRSLECVIGILGILKAGAAYVPVDPQHPDERIAYILEDTGARICIGESTLCERIQKLNTSQKIELINLRQDAELLNAAPPGRINYSDPDQVVYIIYTSGSTGMPKGVMIEHRHLADHVYGMFKSADLKQCSSFALFASLVADAGHSILFSGLLSGAAVHVLSDDVLLDGAQVVAYLRDHEIDCIKIVPSLWLYYLDADFRPLPRKAIIFGGEAFALNILEVLKQENFSGMAYNHYGPTEATIGKCIHKIDLGRKYYNMPIGKPFSPIAALT
jgi:non-ribosomal peptide synthetase component F/acyl carrier protein